MPDEAFRVHGLSLELLKDKPRFPRDRRRSSGFRRRCAAGDRITRSFDLGFLNAELERAEQGRCSPATRMVDTLLLARRKYPGGSNRLDDLCLRYRIDTSHRTKHGALLDAELLAEVYVELIGARQATLILVENGEAQRSHRRATDRDLACAPRPLGAALDAERARGASQLYRDAWAKARLEQLSFDHLPQDLDAAADTAAMPRRRLPIRPAARCR